MRAEIDASDFLPADGGAGLLVGRVWAPGDTPGPAVVAIGPDGVTDVSHRVPTVAALLDADDPAQMLHAVADGPRLGGGASVSDGSTTNRTMSRSLIITRR